MNEKAETIIEIYETFISLTDAEKQEAIQAIGKVNKKLADALTRIQDAGKEREGS